MIRLHPNEVVYFNHLFAGTVDKASQRYETDYWRHSQKQGIRWIEENYRDEFSEKIKIASMMVSNIHQIDTTRMVQVDYWQEPDFYLGNTRYDKHRVIPGEILHILRAGEAGILYIIRPDEAFSDDPFYTESRYAPIFRASIYARSAKELLRRGAHLRAAKAYLRLARSQVALGNGVAARAARQSAISVFADPQAANRQAAEFARINRFSLAKELLLGLTSSDPDRSEYLTNLVVVLLNLEEFDAARSRCENLMRLSPDVPEPYLLRVLVELESGDFIRAERALKSVSDRFPNLDQLSNYEQMLNDKKVEPAATY